MKLRIQDNSIRLRLNQTEIERFREVGCVEGQTTFGPDYHHALLYSMEISPSAEEITAHFVENRIRILVPTQEADGWAYSDQVQLKKEQRLRSGGSLSILVEKDFADHKTLSSTRPTAMLQSNVC